MYKTSFIIRKSFLKYYLFSAEDGTQDDILWDTSESSNEDVSTSEYDSQNKHWRSILIK